VIARPDVFEGALKFTVNWLPAGEVMESITGASRFIKAAEAFGGFAISKAWRPVRVSNPTTSAVRALNRKSALKRITP
jgi:hypothetical protein